MVDKSTFKKKRSKYTFKGKKKLSVKLNIFLESFTVSFFHTNREEIQNFHFWPFGSTMH